MIEPTKKLAIGLPVSNSEVFLPETLECIRAQSFTDFELIISDNASTDSTEKICRDFANRDARIRYIRQPKNLGAIPNFNHVFEVSNSQYFKWAAADDLLEETYLERAVRLLDENPDILWCHSKSSHIDHKGQPLTERSSQNISYHDRGNPSPSGRLKAILLDDQGCLDSYGLIRSSAIRRTSLFIPYYGPEKVFIAEIALQGRYAEIPETLFFVRVTECGSGAIASAQAQNAFAVGEESNNPHLIRLSFLLAYVRAIYRTPVGFLESTKSYCVLLRWLFQISKWPSLMLRALRKQGIGGRNIGRIKHHKKPDFKLMDNKR